MAIGNAVQHGSWIYIYDDKGKQTATVQIGGSAPGDGFKGYTSTTVNVQHGSWTHIYDEKGTLINTIQR